MFIENENLERESAKRRIKFVPQECNQNSLSLLLLFFFIIYTKEERRTKIERISYLE